MGGIPCHSIKPLWNMASICIELGWTPEQYRKASHKDTQAIISMLSARSAKQKQENSKHG